MTDIFASDFPDLQSAISCAASTGKTLHLSPRATYSIYSSLVLDGVSVRIDGHGATIISEVPMLATMILKNGTWLRMHDVTLTGARVAKHVVFCAGAGGSHITDCTMYFGTHDGIHLAAEGAAGGNDCMRFERCRIQHNGRTHSITATITKTDTPSLPGYATEPTISAPDAQFISWGTRVGDFVHVGDEWLPVSSIISETEAKLQLYPLCSGFESALATIHIGDGYHEESFNDNNLVVLRDCLFRGNAGSGGKFCGLFGARVQSGQFDFNQCFAGAVGHRGGAVIISSFRDCYAEGNGGPAAFWLGGAQGIEIASLNTDKPAVVTSNPTPSWGTTLNVQNNAGLKNASANWVGSNLPIVS